ncbi:MAG: nickel transporter [Deltaproteobacteria bacterium]|nr:MAG: nickel transporter [Deltaproteobacteria bacterium]
MKKKILVLSAIIAFAISTPVMAHFQMVYTPESALDKAKTIDMKLVFTHPFEAGHTMNMGTPVEFFVVRKGNKKDLTDKLKPITWKSLTNSGSAFELSYKLRGMGDNVFCLIPSPYYEKEEDIYIQQITKMYVNTAGFPTDWDAEIGLPTEIVPLDKPYGLWTGNVFRGIVMRNGLPVPYAELEVEYMNHKPLMDSNSFSKEAEVEAPQDSFVTMGIKANSQGEFSFGIPRAGWWGFCALGSGPATEYKGKELSQDAVIWIQAKDMK